MNCGEFKRFADAHVDRELTTRDSGRVQAHLKGCEHCQGWVEIVKRTRIVIKASVVKPAAPESLALRIRNTINGD